jgi:hypothetical protein
MPPLSPVPTYSTERKNKIMAEPPRFASTPADVALMDQALAEADNDCLRLVDHLRAKDGDRARATAELVQGLLDSASWDRLELASTLGAAVAILADIADSSAAQHLTKEES